MEIIRYFKEYSNWITPKSYTFICRSIGDVVDIETIGTREIAGVEEFFHSSHNSVCSREIRSLFD